MKMQVAEKNQVPLDKLINKLSRKRFLGLVVAGHLLKNFRLPTPVVATCKGQRSCTQDDIDSPIFQHLGRSLDEVSGNAMSEQSVERNGLALELRHTWFHGIWRTWFDLIVRGIRVPFRGRM